MWWDELARVYLWGVVAMVFVCAALAGITSAQGRPVWSDWPNILLPRWLRYAVVSALAATLWPVVLVAALVIVARGALEKA
ncbi:MAG TPA: hypothetical protein VJV75_03825 [Candidatus Polarisedimenticolia bacterium]|nr:hypothetical protein [Candidatus Polarisedimenticolia bacterium]